jgi:hypothetical protein
VPLRAHPRSSSTRTAITSVRIGAGSWAASPAARSRNSLTASAALIDLVGTGYFPDGSRILYAHLGGTPALNGYAYAFRNG